MIRCILFLLFISQCTSSIAQGLDIISWNIRDFGKSRDDTEIEMMAEILKPYDIIAIQEVVAKDPGGAKAVARLSDVLNRKGAKWDYIISDPTSSSSSYIKERYAYIWKTSKARLSNRGYLIKELKDVIEREPYLAKFTVKGKDLILLNYHACTHTKAFPERREVEHLSSWINASTYSNLVLCGDMNLVIEDKAFNSLKKNGFNYSLNGEKTTLKTKCKSGEYLSSAEDNVFFKLQDFNYITSDVIDFVTPENCQSVTSKRVSLSDHLPILTRIKITK